MFVFIKLFPKCVDCFAFLLVLDHFVIFLINPEVCISTDVDSQMHEFLKQNFKTILTVEANILFKIEIGIKLCRNFKN